MIDKYSELAVRIDELVIKFRQEIDEEQKIPETNWKADGWLSTAVCSQRIGIYEYKPESDVYGKIFDEFNWDSDQRISEV